MRSDICPMEMLFNRSKIRNSLDNPLGMEPRWWALMSQSVSQQAVLHIKIFRRTLQQHSILPRVLRLLK